MNQPVSNNYPMNVPAGANGANRKRNLQSQFVGSTGKFFWLRLGVFLLALIPIVGLPNSVCIYKRYVCKNTYVVGVPLQFEGKAGELLLNIIKWCFFSIITIGIYALVLLPERIKQWEAANTIFGPVAG